MIGAKRRRPLGESESAMSGVGPLLSRASRASAGAADGIDPEADYLTNCCRGDPEVDLSPRSGHMKFGPANIVSSPFLLLSSPFSSLCFMYHHKIHAR